MMPATPVPLDPFTAAHGARLDALHEKQSSQDAAIVRIEAKVDGLKTWMMGVLVTTCGALATGLGALLLLALGRAK
jgi:hypothetical protein